MLTLAGTNTIAGIAGTTTAITYTITGAEVTTGTPTYKVLAQGQLATSASTIYTVPAAPATALVKTIHLANVTGSAVAGVALYVNGTSAGNRISGSFTIPANGWATVDADGWRIYDANGALKTSGDPGPTGPAGPTGPQGPDGANGVATTVEVDLGSVWKREGKFTLVDASISTSSQIHMWQAPGPYTGKGMLADEPTFAPIDVLAVIPGTGSAVVHWRARGHVAMRPQSYDRRHGGAVQVVGAVVTQNAAILDNMNTRLVAVSIGKVRGNCKFTYQLL